MTRRRLLALIAAAALSPLGCEREREAVQQDLPAARAARARADAQAIASAVRAHQATCGQLPETLDALTTQATVGGGPCGPFLRAIPEPPAGWSAYQFQRGADGATFAISTSGGGLTVAVP